MKNERDDIIITLLKLDFLLYKRNGITKPCLVNGIIIIFYTICSITMFFEMFVINMKEIDTHSYRFI